MVLRDGQFVGDGNVRDVTEADVIRMMVGRTLTDIFPKVQVPIGEVVLEVSGLCAPLEFADISFELRRSEILGFYGLVGAGRSEVMRALFGLTRPTAGTTRIDGSAVALKSPRSAIKAGIAYVPEDRQRDGVITSLPIRDNVVLPILDRLAVLGFCRSAARVRRHPAGRRGPVGPGIELDAAGSRTVRRQSAKGGDREVARNLAPHHHSRRADQGHRHIREGRGPRDRRGDGEPGVGRASCVFGTGGGARVADRIIVMYRGRIAGRFDRGEADREKILACATGAA